MHVNKEKLVLTLSIRRRVANLKKRSKNSYHHIPDNELDRLIAVIGSRIDASHLKVLDEILENVEAGGTKAGRAFRQLDAFIVLVREEQQ